MKLVDITGYDDHSCCSVGKCPHCKSHIDDWTSIRKCVHCGGSITWDWHEHSAYWLKKKMERIANETNGTQ